MKPYSTIDHHRKRPFPRGTFLKRFAWLPWLCAVTAVLYGSVSVADTLIPLFPSASSPNRQGFVRVVNHSDRQGEVSITATDDAGQTPPPVLLFIAANEAVHLNSTDLERGNLDKGLSAGIGAARRSTGRSSRVGRLHPWLTAPPFAPAHAQAALTHPGEAASTSEREA